MFMLAITFMKSIFDNSVQVIKITSFIIIQNNLNKKFKLVTRKGFTLNRKFLNGNNNKKTHQ